MNAELLERLDGGLRGNLGSLSLVVTELLALLEQREVDLAVLERLIGRDQGLASRILRIANSPFYGMSRAIGSLHDATVVLGVHTIRNVVTAAGVMALFDGPDSGTFSRVAFWQHAIGTGVASRVLAVHAGEDPEIAFTAGLLHDVGKLVIQTLLVAEFAEILARVDAEQCLIRDAEQQILGFDHAFAGARAAERWKLPRAIQLAIADHHRPDSTSEPALLTDIVHVGDILCRALEIGNGGDPYIPACDERAWDRLALDWSALPGCLADIDRLNSTANLML